MNQELKKEKIKLVTVFIGIYLFVIPLNAFTISGFSVVRFFVILPIACSLLYIGKYNKRNRNLVNFLLFIFLVLVFIQIFYSDYSSVVYKNFTQILMYFVLVFFVSKLGYNKREKAFLKKSFYLSSWLCILLAIVFGHNFMNYRLTVLFPSGTAEDPNYFCGYFIPGIIACIEKVFIEKNIKSKEKIFYIVSLLIMLYICLLTGSRGGLLAIGIGGIFFLFYSQDRTNLKKVFKIVFKFSLVFLILYIGYTYASKNLNVGILNRLSLDTIQETGGNGRYDIWDFLMTRYSSFSLLGKAFGYGFGTTYSVIAAAHNTWITLLFENGIIGTGIFVLIFAILIKFSFKDEDKYFLFLVISYLILSMSLSLIFYKPLWCLIILILCRENDKSDAKGSRK